MSNCAILFLRRKSIRGGGHVTPQHVNQSCGPVLLHHAADGGFHRTGAAFRAGCRFRPDYSFRIRSPAASSPRTLHQRLLLHSHARLSTWAAFVLLRRFSPARAATICTMKSPATWPEPSFWAWRVVPRSIPAAVLHTAGFRFWHDPYRVCRAHVSHAGLHLHFSFSQVLCEKPFTRRKRDRNRIYVASGLIMVACMVAMVGLTIRSVVERRHPSPWLFWCEALALGAFGVAWLTKGEGFMRDKRHQSNHVVGHHRDSSSS